MDRDGIRSLIERAASTVGSSSELARIMGVHRSQVSRWRKMGHVSDRQVGVLESLACASGETLEAAYLAANSLRAIKAAVDLCGASEVMALLGLRRSQVEDLHAARSTLTDEQCCALEGHVARVEREGSRRLHDKPRPIRWATERLSPDPVTLQAAGSV